MPTSVNPEANFVWIIANLRNKYMITLAAVQMPLKEGDQEKEGHLIQIFHKHLSKRRVGFMQQNHTRLALMGRK